MVPDASISLKTALPDSYIRAGAVARSANAAPAQKRTSSPAVEPGIDEPFHEYIGIRAALKYAVFHGLADRKADLMTLDNDCQGRLKEHYSSKNSDRRVTAMMGSFSHYK